MQEFEEALCVMVELAAKPYVRQKANQELYQDGQAALDAVVSSIRTCHRGRDSLNYSWQQALYLSVSSGAL